MQEHKEQILKIWSTLRAVPSWLKTVQVLLVNDLHRQPWEELVLVQELVLVFLL